MFGYIVRRLIAGILVLIAVSMMVFALFFYGPSDPALAYCPLAPREAVLPCPLPMPRPTRFFSLRLVMPW